jgi:hypothetical protein
MTVRRTDVGAVEQQSDVNPGPPVPVDLCPVRHRCHHRRRGVARLEQDVRERAEHAFSPHLPARPEAERQQDVRLEPERVRPTRALEGHRSGGHAGQVRLGRPRPAIPLAGAVGRADEQAGLCVLGKGRHECRGLAHLAAEERPLRPFAGRER